MTNTPTTLFEKVWRQHLVAEPAGEPALLYIDLHLVHEVTSPQAFEGLRLAGRTLRRPDRTVATVDHNVPTTSVHDRLHILDPISSKQIEALRQNCRDFGVTLYDVQAPEQGIVHMIGPELGLTKPGMTIVCGDSHTSTHGAFGALAFGIGTSEVEHVMATQTLPQDKPKTFRINVEGDLPHGVTAKDIILHIIGQIGTAGATGYVVEYAGSAIRALSMEGRMTVCNMSIEAGARAGMIAPDAATFAYLKGRRFSPAAEPGAPGSAVSSPNLGGSATELSDLVLTIVSDDYENLSYMEEKVEKSLPTNRRKPTRADIEAALHALSAEGLLSAFLLDPREPQAKQTTMTLKPLFELWFYATEKGRRTARRLPETLEQSNELLSQESPWDQAVAQWAKFVTDEGATFDRELHIDAAAITPTVSWGTSPGMVTGIDSTVPIADPAASEADRRNFERALDYMGLEPGKLIEEIVVDAVFLGSCTNARIEDLRAAARVVSGHQVATTVRAMVVPGSQAVKAQAEREGLDLIFKTAGFEWREPGCSMCLGMNPDILAPGERCASTSNRNFEGRQGRGGRTHLVSPAMAAAAAITGHFTDIRTWEFHDSPSSTLDTTQMLTEGGSR